MLGTTSDEKMDHFVGGLKRDIKLEVFKANFETLEMAGKIALSVGSALFGMRRMAIGLVRVATLMYGDPWIFAT